MPLVDELLEAIMSDLSFSMSVCPPETLSESLTSKHIASALYGIHSLHKGGPLSDLLTQLLEQLSTLTYLITEPFSAAAVGNGFYGLQVARSSAYHTPFILLVPYHVLRGLTTTCQL